MTTKKPYYGPFVWLAALSLIVPVLVAVEGFRALPRPYTAPEIQPDASGVDNGLWDHLLRTYVEGGLVDYDGLRRDHLFKLYLRQLAHARPRQLDSRADRLALLINAYNAFVINGVITHRIEKSVLDQENHGVGFFDIKEHILAGETVSLNHLEHEVIRPIYGDARVHMALVCAAKSCPSLRSDAFTGEQLQRQLEDQAVLFANNPAYVRFDAESNVVRLSPILKWYGDDFGGRSGYIRFLIDRASDPALRGALQSVLDGTANVDFNDYDWTLNSQSNGGAAAAKKSVEFGSGTIPNE